MSVWVCRTGSDGRFNDLFFDKSQIYLTRENLDYDVSLVEKEEILSHLHAEMSTAAKQTISNIWSQINIFANKMKINDVVLIPKKGHFSISVAIITGEYCFNDHAQYPEKHSRTVRILKKDIDTTSFPRDIFHSIGAFRTIFEIKEADRLIAVLKKKGVNFDEV